MIIEKVKKMNARLSELEEIVKKHKLRNPTLGEIQQIEHKIVLEDDTPVQQNPYFIPFKYWTPLKQEIREMINQGIIRRSNSNYSSPTFVIEKKNGKLRVIHEYIALNSKKRKDGFPFPSLDDQLNGFSEAKIFSTVDLDAGFYQIRMKKEDMHNSIFLVPFDHVEY